MLMHVLRITLGSVLVFRMGAPLWRSTQHRLRVEAVVPEAPGIYGAGQLDEFAFGREIDWLDATTACA